MTIKFSHNYGKLQVAPDHKATLLSVQLVHLEDLPKVFLDYDTDFGKYELPKRGLYMLLVFTAQNGIFTTLRSAYPKKKIDYYTDNVGKEFDIVIVPHPQ